VEQPFIDYGLYATVYYFVFFMILLPSSGFIEKAFVSSVNHKKNT